MNTERERDVKRKRSGRGSTKDVEIPKCIDIRKRAVLEADVQKWLRFFFQDIFTYEFTGQQQEMISAIRTAIEVGGDQSIAASRGEGKTTLSECVLLYCVLIGMVHFAVLFASTGDDATNSLEAIKDHIATNERLHDYYPEACAPVRALENTPNRAHYQTVSDGSRKKPGFIKHPSRFKWCGREIKLPDVPGSRSRGAIVATRGLDSAVRGLKIGNLRPELAVIDDPDTIETISSEQQATKLEMKIERGIAGLGGQRRSIARVMLTTLQNNQCVSAKFTSDQKPSWHPKRFKFLIRKPENLDLWVDFVRLQKSDWENGTSLAHGLYLSNRATMDAGAIIANPNRMFPGQSSALEHYFVWVARIGQASVSSEFDNDPPDENSENGQLTSATVGRRISGLDHRQLPADCQKIVSFIDLGEQSCHWVDVGWSGRCVGSILDYGTIDVRSGEFNPLTRTRDPKTLEIAITNALHEWRTNLLSKYRDADGQPKELDCGLIDSGSGLHTKTVYRFCREVGRPFSPSKGREAGFKIPANAIRRGDFWYLARQPDGVLLYEHDATEWKKFMHQRFITETFDANAQRGDGSLALFICPDHSQFKKDRLEFTHQIVSKIWGSKRPGAKPTWITRGSGRDHYEDATAGCCLAANIVGVRLQPDLRGTQKKMTFAEMAAAAKQKA